MTSNDIARVHQALEETKRLLARELTYRVDFQKKDMVDFYHQHIAKLNAMLAQ